MDLYVGLHQPSDARRFARCFISVNRLRGRKSDFVVGDWIMDSGAFTEVVRHGGYRWPASEYAAQVRRWRSCGRLLAAVAQDYMCEPFVLEQTGLSVADHQRLTISRYDALSYHARDTGVYLMPVLQGYQPAEYVSHIRQYGRRLRHGAWVGVGSVCKRNTAPGAVEAVLLAIRAERPDLHLHAFGLKQTSLTSSAIRALIHTADSMAWSFAARREGRDANDWREAAAFVETINTCQSPQLSLWSLAT